jgi:hypothetical protein
MPNLPSNDEITRFDGTLVTCVILVHIKWFLWIHENIWETLYSLLEIASVSLKVHKNENFFVSNFEFCSISLLVMLKYYGFVKKNFDGAFLGELRLFSLVLRLWGTKKFFKLGQFF